MEDYVDLQLKNNFITTERKMGRWSCKKRVWGASSVPLHQSRWNLARCVSQSTTGASRYKRQRRTMYAILAIFERCMIARRITMENIVQDLLQAAPRQHWKVLRDQHL